MSVSEIAPRGTLKPVKTMTQLCLYGDLVLYDNSPNMFWWETVLGEGHISIMYK